MTHTLYLCYLGLREPLVQTQVLPYLRELAGCGLRVSLLTFEPKFHADWSRDSIIARRSQLQTEGIDWHALPYHKRPSLPATLYDIWAGARLARRLVQQKRIEVLHARSHVAAAMGALAKQWTGAEGVKLIFDIRGFMPEEYTDAGIWPENGWLYRGVKIIERQLMKTSDAFIVLTSKAREILFPGGADTDQMGRPIEIIPCCVDQRRFRAAEVEGRDEIRRAMNLAGRRVLVYVGSLDGWYLTEEMLDFCVQAHQQDPRSYTLLLTPRDVERAQGRLGKKRIPGQDYLVTAARPEEVPRYLWAADVALSFIKPGFSKQSSSPTKIAEYLAAGLPIISNAGIGDLDDLIKEEGIGVIVRDFTPRSYGRALSELAGLGEPEMLRARCQAVARTKFDLQRVGGHRYRRLYERLLLGRQGAGFQMSMTLTAPEDAVQES